MPEDIVTPPETPPTTPPAQDPPAFDPANLPPEFLSMLDKERTQASKTARANALKDAAKDPQIQAQVRASLEEEARMTADERVALKERELEQKAIDLAVRQNRVTVESLLITNGIEKESAVELATALSTEDEKVSAKKAEAFVASFNAAVNAKVDALKNELLANGSAPKKGEGAPSTEEQYKAAYAEATKSGNTAVALHIQRKAAVEGITIQ